MLFFLWQGCRGTNGKSCGWSTQGAGSWREDANQFWLVYCRVSARESRF